jgi:hypothetical protein
MLQGKKLIFNVKELYGASLLESVGEGRRELISVHRQDIGKFS